MSSRVIPQLKEYIDGLQLRKQELEQEARDCQHEAQLIAAQAVRLEELVSTLPDTASPSCFQEVFEDLPVPIVLSGVGQTGVQANRAARELPGCGMAGSKLPVWLQEELTLFLFSTSQERSSERLVEQEEGQPLQLQLAFKRLSTACGAGVVVAMHDITRHKNLEQALRISEERYRTLVENQSDLVVKIDRTGTIQFASPSFSRIMEINEDDLVGRQLFPLLAGDQHAGILERLLERASQLQVCYEEFSMQTGQGSQWFGWSFKAVNGDESGFICIGRDIAEQKKAELNIQQLAYYDNLTGLPNRVLLQDRLAQALSQTRRSETRTALLFLDLDRFKTVNDTLGHQAGDDLLKQVAQRLRENIRDADTVARQGGDEFVIVLNGIEHGRQAAKVASKIIAALTQPFMVNGHNIYSGASVGIAVYPDDGNDPGTLLKYADMAMYLAKESGRGKFKFFSQDLNDRMRERAQMEGALRQAIERNELFLQYQPQFNIRDRRLTGLEAFVRWNHPEQGVLMPARFIPLAEETGLVVPLGEWVMRTACRQAAGWQQNGRQPVPVSINLSARQFRHPELLELVARSLVDSGLPPTCLELEITEETLLENLDEAAATLHELKWQGVQLTIDDFGTGYSSLAHLRRFPINRLKIDHSFVRNLHASKEDADIAEAIISVGNTLKLQVVAEGVEQAEQLQFLHERGCEEMQGHYFSHPLAAADLARCGWFTARA